jgi:hypothetical protein
MSRKGKSVAAQLPPRWPAPSRQANAQIRLPRQSPCAAADTPKYSVAGRIPGVHTSLGEIGGIASIRRRILVPSCSSAFHHRYAGLPLSFRPEVRAADRSGEIWSRTRRVMVYVRELRTGPQPFRTRVRPVNPRYVNARLDFSTPLRFARNDKKKGPVRFGVWVIRICFRFRASNFEFPC